VHPTSQLTFDLEVESVPPPALAVIGSPPDGLPDRDRAAAVRKLATLIAKLHAATGPVGDDDDE
jgi:hypothetical protein